MSFLGRVAGALSGIGASLQRPAQNITSLSRCIVVRGHSSLTSPVCSQNTLTHYPSCTTGPGGTISPCSQRSSLLSTNLPVVNSVRNLVRYSIRKGLRKTVKAVPSRFYRLPWGIYVRTTSGRHKHRWKKNAQQLRFAEYHVFCNKQQSRMLDKMTTKYWKKHRHFPDDPYAPYYKRTGMNHFYPTHQQPSDGHPKYWP